MKRFRIGLYFVAAIGSAFMLGGCATGGDSVPKVVATFGDASPEPSALTVCYGHGCSRSVPVSLTPEPWDEVAALFAKPPESAADERARIAHALQIIEIAVGQETGLSADLGGSFAGAFKGKQMDCVDEMVNVSRALSMFEAHGFLHFYRPGRRLTSTFFGPRGPWPHTVASIVARDGDGEGEYIIDTWIEPPGVLPYIMPVEDWRARKKLARAF